MLLSNQSFKYRGLFSIQMNQLYFRFWGEKFKLFSPVKKYFLHNGKNHFEHAFLSKRLG